MTPIQKAVQAWHALAAAGDPSGLDGLLADGAVFHSPVVHTPQQGKVITRAYLAAALQVLGNPTFRYVNEIVGDSVAALEFVVEIDGILIDGIDLITADDTGRISEFKVFIRPLQAVNLVHRLMGERLRRDAGGSPAGA